MSKPKVSDGNSRREELRKRMKAERHGEISKTHELLIREDPEFAEKYDDLFALLMTEDRTLSIHTKELIVMGMLAVKGQYGALKMHIQRALKVGVTQAEIVEMLEVAMMYGGTESMIHGGLALLETLESK